MCARSEPLPRSEAHMRPHPHTSLLPNAARSHRQNQQVAHALTISSGWERPQWSRQPNQYASLSTGALACVQPTGGIRSDPVRTPISQILSGTIQRTERMTPEIPPQEEPQVTLPHSWIPVNAFDVIHSPNRNHTNYVSVSHNSVFPPPACHSSAGTARPKRV